MNDTRLVFVTGSGRCGTAMMKKLLSGVPEIEARHEYVRNYYQRAAVLYYMERLSWKEMAQSLRDVYEPARHYSSARTFLDATHKLAYCTDVVQQVFPQAKFVHLIRNGRRVVSSFYYKLNIFDQKCYEQTMNWLDGNDPVMPPLEEKYWWPRAPKGYSMFQRICHHWAASNLTIAAPLADIDENLRIAVKLESLQEEAGMRRLLKFLDVEYDPSFLEAMQKPKHVYVPVNYKLTDEQEEQFTAICGPLMERYGYEGDYSVAYRM